jgi:hypothetical protein
MAENGKMIAVELVDKLMGSEHADVVCESVAWLVAEVMEAEVSGPDRHRAGRGQQRARDAAQRVKQSVHRWCASDCGASQAAEPIGDRHRRPPRMSRTTHVPRREPHEQVKERFVV